MGRAVTKNAQGELEVTESFTFSGSNPTLDSVKLIAVDGEEATVENPSWLGFTKSASGSDLDVIIQLDADGGISTYTTYTFRVEASDDAGTSKSRRVDVGIGSLATDFAFAHVAGEEDKGRQENGRRVERGGVARVIARTSMDATLELEYVQNPNNVDNPTFTQTQSDVSTGKRDHEFFFSVNPSSVIAFRLTADGSFDQSVSTIQSGIYYIVTGDEIAASATAGDISVSVSIIPPPPLYQEDAETSIPGTSSSIGADFSGAATISPLVDATAQIITLGTIKNVSATVGSIQTSYTIN